MSMTWTEYQDQVKTDALESIEENFEYCDDWDAMRNQLFIDDSVTGNGSGSYTFSTAKAAENVSGIIFDLEAVDAFKEYGYSGIPTEEGAETCDVIARCIALDYVAYDLEERFNELKNSNLENAKKYPFSIQDSYGAPQCGIESKYFESWEGVARYLELNPDVLQRINDGYAVIKER